MNQKKLSLEEFRAIKSELKEFIIRNVEYYNSNNDNPDFDKDSFFKAFAITYSNSVY